MHHSGALPVLTLGDHGAGKEVREIEWHKEDGIDALPNLIVSSVITREAILVVGMTHRD